MLIVVHEVSGRDEAPGKERGKCNTGGFPSRNVSLGSVYRRDIDVSVTISCRHEDSSHDSSCSR